MERGRGPGCGLEGKREEVGVVGGALGQAGVRPPAVMEREVAPDARRRSGHGVVAMEIDLFVLERPPESLDEDILAPAALVVHAHLDGVLAHQPRNGHARELRALISVGDGRPAVARQRLLHHPDAQAAVERDGDPPAQEPAIPPIQDCCEIHEAVRHRNVRDVHGRDVIRPRDRATAQQIALGRTRAVPTAGARLRVDGGNSHTEHQRANPPLADAGQVLRRTRRSIHAPANGKSRYKASVSGIRPRSPGDIGRGA